MSHPRKPKPAPEPVVDHRAPDQDAAVEAAFVAGTLPEEDRREPVVSEHAEMPAVETTVFRSIEDRVEVGGQIERTASGWKVHLMYGGLRRLHGEGATIEAALAEAGA